MKAEGETGNACHVPSKAPGQGCPGLLRLWLLQRGLQFLSRLFYSLSHNRIRFGLSLLRFLSDLDRKSVV